VFWRGVLITLGVVMGVRQFVVEARYIPSGSMLPGLQIQDRLLVEEAELPQPLTQTRRNRGVSRAAPFRSGAERRAAGRPAALPAGEPATDQRHPRPAGAGL